MARYKFVDMSPRLLPVDLTCRLSSDEELVEDSTRGWV